MQGFPFRSKECRRLLRKIGKADGYPSERNLELSAGKTRDMKPNGYGKVINIGSICGHVIRPELRHSCCVSKAAGIHMTRAAAPELIKSGTRGKTYHSRRNKSE